MTTWTDEEIRDLGRQGRLAQGLPEKIEDPIVLARVATLFTGRPVKQLEQKSA